MKGNVFYIVLFFLGIQVFCFSQEKTETVKIIKQEELKVYRGDTSTLSDWYLVVSPNQKYYLLNLKMSPEEVVDWFKKFENSQNIFSTNFTDVDNVLSFKKENNPDEILNFEFILKTEEQIDLLYVETKEKYQFYKQNVRSNP